MKESLRYIVDNCEEINSTLSLVKDYHKNSDCLEDFSVDNIEKIF